MQSNAELIRAVRAGDRDCFSTLVSRYERAVWATAWRILRDNHAAADASQEAFLQVYRRLHDLREPTRFGVWLLRITQREATRLARRRRLHATRPIEEAIDRPEEGDRQSGGLDADSEVLLAAIAGLPEHERLVIVLRYIDGHSVAEIAEICGRPIGTVTKQLSRGVDRLRHSLKEVNS